MLTRRQIIQGLTSFALGMGIIKIPKVKGRKITDTVILDCLVYAREQLYACRFDAKKPVLFVSSLMCNAIRERFNAYEIPIAASSLGDMKVIVKDNINWGDGPEYTCWLGDGSSKNPNCLERR